MVQPRKHREQLAPVPQTEKTSASVSVEKQKEQLRSREQKDTVTIEESKGFLEEALSGLRKKLKKQKKSQKTIPQVRDQVVLQIEKIMENGLEDSFREMTPIQKQEFKIEGEKAAIEIRTLLRSTRVKIKKVFQILLSWLSLLPGINNFFLEQEAKIKADKIMAIRDHITTKR